MPWDDVINQRRVCESLRRAAAQDRVAHAYLFHGAEGTGKRAAALQLAQVLLCEHNQGSSDGNACGTCLSCTKVDRMLHPDVHVLIPHPKGADHEDLAERIKLLARSPYEPVDFVRRPNLGDPTKSSNKQVFYPIDRVHEDLLRPMSLTPLEGSYKVAIVTDVELMRAEAANAFLKLLEEPPKNTVFVLTTSRKEQLLPTIVSRCQQLRFDPLSVEHVEEALVRREGIDRDKAGTLARMSDGSYMRALDLSQNEELLANRMLVLDFLRYAYVGKASKLSDTVDEISGLGREGGKRVLDLMLRWLRDLMLYRTQGKNAQLVNVDQKEAVERFCQNVPQANLEAMAALVEEAIYLAERNVHIALLLVTLAHALRRGMHGSPETRLYIPLPELNLKQPTRR